MQSLLRKALPFATIALFVVLVVATEYLVHMEQQHELNDLKQETHANANLIRANIEHKVNTALNLNLGLLVYVSVHPNIDQADFQFIARQIMRKTPILRNLALARNNIITHIYPLHGNEQALGLDYMQLPAQKKAVLRAIRAQNTVIAGPLKLVQGGEGFISRAPIYTGKNGQDYWGIASLVIDADTFYDAIGLPAASQNAQFAIRGKDSLGEEGAVFYGDPALFEDARNPHISISLPNGSWILASAPLQGWHNSSTRVWVIRFLGYTLAVIICLLLFALLGSYRAINHQALHDPLTGLPNRRLLQEYFAQFKASAQRSRKHFYLLYFDLDRFKPINDQFGHKEGDRVLIEVANRLKGCLREIDIISRVGGDEFVLLVRGLKNPGQITALQLKISTAICKPYRLSNGKTVEIDVSIGVSAYPTDGTLYGELISRADTDMYQHKSSKQAKNRTPA